MKKVLDILRHLLDDGYLLPIISFYVCSIMQFGFQEWGQMSQCCHAKHQELCQQIDFIGFVDLFLSLVYYLRPF